MSERYECGPFLVVLAIAVTAGRGLVEIRFISHRLQLGRHLARVSGMDAGIPPRRGRRWARVSGSAAVSPPRGGNQDRWIFLPGLCGVIGGISLQPCPFF